MKIGITGHQDLGSAEPWVQTILREVIVGLKATEGFTSLARGADQIFAELCRDLDLPYVAVVPCSSYEETFDKEETLRKYNDLLHCAHRVTVLDFFRPQGIAFYEAGKRVVDLSEWLIAVWDGKKSRHLGGTGDAVDYALAAKKRIAHINPLTRKLEVI